MTDHTAPELIWVYDGSHGAWAYGGWDKAGQSDTNNRLEYIPRPEVDALAAAAILRPLSDEDREWIDARADELFRDSERQRGSVRIAAIRPWDWRDYFVPQATAERLASADARAALRAHTEAVVRRAVKVKPLVWTETKWGSQRAVTAVGTYEVGFDDGWWCMLEGPEPWDWTPEYDCRTYIGPTAGMKAAQADYEARILSALADPAQFIGDRK